MKNLDLITDPVDIFTAILKSKEAGTIIGVNSPTLGGFTYLTAVEDITVDDALNVYVIFQPCDTSGFFFPTRRVRLDKIYSVKPFTSQFKNLWVEKNTTTGDDLPNLLHA
jgi:hypothetical protein